MIFRVTRLLIPTLILFSLIAGCSKEKQADQISKNQWKVFSYLPSESYYLFYMNIPELKKASFLSGYLQNQFKDRTESNWLSELEKNSGVGFDNGLKEIFITNSWTNNNAAVVTFEPGNKKILNYLNSSYFEKTGSYYTRKKDPVSYYLLADDHTLVIYNSREYAEQVAAGSNRNLKSNKSFIELVDNISYKKQYWFASNQKMFAYALLKRLAGSSGKKVESIIKNVNSVSLSASFSSDVNLESNWGCTGSSDAILFSGAVKTALSMDLLSAKNPELNKIVRKTKVERTGNRVNLNLNLSGEEVSKLKNLINNFPGNKI